MILLFQKLNYKMLISQGRLLLIENEEYYELIIKIIKILPPEMFIYGSSIVSLIRNSIKTSDFIQYDDFDIGMIKELSQPEIIELFCTYIPDCKLFKITKKFITFVVKNKFIQVSLKIYDSHDACLDNIDFPVCRMLIMNTDNGPCLLYKQEAVNGILKMKMNLDLSRLTSATAYRCAKYMIKGFQIRVPGFAAGKYVTCNGDEFIIEKELIISVKSAPVSGYDVALIPAEKYFK